MESRQLELGTDSLGNPRKASIFETELAYALLASAPSDILVRINYLIIEYLVRIQFKPQASDINFRIQEQLRKYKFIFTQSLSF